MIKLRFHRVSFKALLLACMILAAMGVVVRYSLEAWEGYQSEQIKKQTMEKQATTLLTDEEGEDAATRILDYASVASMYSDEGEHQKALDMYLKAQTLCDQQKEVTIACNPGYNELIGDVYQQQGDEAQAKTYWQKALADYKRLRTAELSYEEDIKRVEAK